MYQIFWKRALDLILSIIALTALFPVFLVLAVLGAVMMGENPFFTQPRPGRIDPATGKEKIFSLIKFKSMKSVRNEKGEMLSDEERITPYGRWLRRSSLDELPQLINIILGERGIIETTKNNADFSRVVTVNSISL